MKVTNILDIDTRDGLYSWFLENHDREREFWIRVNRARNPHPGVIDYADAVEVALCFGWIDSTMKRIDSGKAVQRFSRRRKDSNWCETNIVRYVFRNLKNCRKYNLFIGDFSKFATVLRNHRYILSL